MKATITDITQRFSFETGTFANYLVLRLPSGRNVTVSTDDDTVAAVLAEAQGGTTETQPHPEPLQPAPRRAPPSPPPPPPVTPMGVDFIIGQETQGSLAVVTKPEPVTLLEIDDGPQETPVDWPERQLPHHVESGLVDWETLPDTQLPPSIKRVLRDSRIAKLITIDDLDQLKAEIIRHMTNKPKAGKVSWDTGPRRQIESAQRRSVPKDEAGNPIPPGGILEMPERDPGEVRDEDDGVQQA
jgi:hypothetical protein